METLLNIAEVAAVVRLSEQTIRRYVLQKEIPFHKIKKVVRFRPSELEDWISHEGRLPDCGVDDSKERELFDFPVDLDRAVEVRG